MLLPMTYDIYMYIHIDDIDKQGNQNCCNAYFANDKFVKVVLTESCAIINLWSNQRVANATR